MVGYYNMVSNILPVDKILLPQYRYLEGKKYHKKNNAIFKYQNKGDHKEMYCINLGTKMYYTSFCQTTADIMSGRGFVAEKSSKVM